MTLPPDAEGEGDDDLLDDLERRSDEQRERLDGMLEDDQPDESDGGGDDG